KGQAIDLDVVGVDSGGQDVHATVHVGFVIPDGHFSLAAHISAPGMVLDMQGGRTLTFVPKLDFVGHLDGAELRIDDITTGAAETIPDDFARDGNRLGGRVTSSGAIYGQPGGPVMEWRDGVLSNLGALVSELAFGGADFAAFVTDGPPPAGTLLR